MHAEVTIGNSMVMLGEATEQWRPMPAKIALYVEHADAWYKRALEAGASSAKEPSDQFYGDRSAGVQDFAGNHWWIHTHIEDVSPEEIKKRAESWMKQQKRNRTRRGRTRTSIRPCPSRSSSWPGRYGCSMESAG
jgi:hypothetical protein